MERGLVVDLFVYKMERLDPCVLTSEQEMMNRNKRICTLSPKPRIPKPSTKEYAPVRPACYMAAPQHKTASVIIERCELLFLQLESP